jgi:putative transposase
VLYEKVRDDAREIISTIYKDKDVDIIAGAVCIDHVHLSVVIPPKLCISNFIVY